MNPNTTPEEMARQVFEEHSEHPEGYCKCGFCVCSKDHLIHHVAEAIQSARREASRQAQQRIEELEKVVGFVAQTGVCHHSPMNEDLQDSYFNETCARCMTRQALNPKKEGSEED